MFYNEGRNLQIWHKILMVSAAIVIALSFVNFGEVESWLKPIYNLIILLMIVSAIVSAWYASEGRMLSSSLRTVVKQFNSRTLLLKVNICRFPLR